MHQDMITSKSIISHDEVLKKGFITKNGIRYLKVSEFFYDTIQGEGIYTGVPSTFLRLTGCSLNCSYCDTTPVWKYGVPYTFKELFGLMESTDCVDKLKKGQHLVISGGSPLLQQDRLIEFLKEFESIYEFRPFIEVENECVFMPWAALEERVQCWNNSPKLISSNVPVEHRYQPDVVAYMSRLYNSWFKFVINNEEQWDEIDLFFLNPGFIKRNQIILMPEGASKEELEKNRLLVVDLAVRHNVRYCTREHIILWDKNIGV